MALKRNIILGAALAGFAGAVFTALNGDGSAATALQKFYSAAVSEKDGVSIKRDIAYGPSGRHRLDIYEPSNGDGAGPIVIFLYGGSWSSGQRGIYGFVGAALAAHGITTIIPDYRLYPEVQFPAFFEDAALAYAWTWRKFLSGRAEARPVVLAGHSAGGHMAALLSLDRSYLRQAALGAPRPSAFVSLAGPVTFDPTTWPGTRDAFSTVASTDLARPIAFVTKDAPPSLLIHGLEDTIVQLKNAYEMEKALKAAGASVRLIEYPGIGHIGLITALSRPLRWRAPVLQEMVDFIQSLPR